MAFEGTRTAGLLAISCDDARLIHVLARGRGLTNGETESLGGFLYQVFRADRRSAACDLRTVAFGCPT